MENKKKSPANKRQYRVYATDVLFQDVEATSAAEAYRKADEHPCFESCGSSLRLDPDVKDIETDEFIRVGAKASHCKTCGSEIVVTINDSAFDDGECGRCEYRRYRASQELYEAAVHATACLGDLVRDGNATDDDVEAYEELKRAVAYADEPLAQSDRKSILRSRDPKEHGQAA
jgi:hypothetical protein